MSTAEEGVSANVTGSLKEAVVALDGGRPDALLSAVDHLGRPTAGLLFLTGWMQRRTDTVELISDTWVRQTTSIDFAIPRKLVPITAPRDGREAYYAVPVLLLPKVRPTLMRFDFRCGSQELTLPTRRQNCLTAYAALLWAAASCLKLWPLPRNLRDELMFVAMGRPDYAKDVSWHMRAPAGGSPVLPESGTLPTLADAEQALVEWCEQLADDELGEIGVERAGTVSADDLAKLNNELAEHRMSAWLLRKLSVNSPLIAHVRRARTGRQTVRLAYDENLFKSKVANAGKGAVARNGWLPYTYEVSTPYVGAASYHFEFIAPPGIEACHSELIVRLAAAHDNERQEPEAILDRGRWTTARIRAAVNRVKARFADADAESPAPRAGADGSHNDDGDSKRPEYDYLPNRGEQLHLYRIEQGVPWALSARVDLRASREGFIASAALAALAIAVILTLCAILTGPLVSNGTGAHALLLLIPGALAAVISRADNHALTIRLLQRARRTLLISGAAAFLGAGLLTLIETGDGTRASSWHRWMFALLAAVAIWQALKLLLARALPRPPAQRGVLERVVDGAASRAQARVLRRVRRRQRSLRLQVAGDGLSRHAVSRLASDDGNARRLRIRAMGTSIQIAAHRDARPLLLATASPGDTYASQDLEMARRLADTIRWLGDQPELAAGFTLEIRWTPLMRRLRDRLAGTRPTPRPLHALAPRSAEHIAVAARRGELCINRIHVIAPSAAAEASSSAS